ncbi:MAG: hypothetical protein WCO21_03435 [bacterium]
MMEQEERQVDWALIVGASIFVLVIFAGTYYLLFTNPSSIEKILPSNTQEQTEKIAIAPLKYDAVIAQLQNYKNNFPAVVKTSDMGRPNPFQP